MTDGPKRFYKEVTLIPEGHRFAVALDGRPARTVGRHVLAANKTLAEALAQEWRAQEETIDLTAMPLTRLHGFVLDAGEEGKAQFIDTIVQYAGSDLLCYRAEDETLAARQEAMFGPFLKKAAEEGLPFEVTTGLLPVEQPPETLLGLRARLEGLDLGELFPRKL
ncbi:MAG: ATPase, partial [Parvularculaceae bacterium]|nr:ATPase [Parvularculaceae bacterium]